MKKVIYILVFFNLLLIPVFSSNSKIAGLGGVGMNYPEEGVSLNFNPAAVQVMESNTLSLNTGNKGKEKYFVQLDILGKISATSNFALSFQVNDAFKKAAITTGFNFSKFIDVGVSSNYIQYQERFQGVGFNVGVSKKIGNSFWGVALINAGNTYLNSFNDESDYHVNTSTPLTFDNYWSLLDPSQHYIINISTDQYKLPEELSMTTHFVFQPNFVVGINIRKRTNNFKDLKIDSESVIYTFDQNFPDKSAIRGAYSKEFWTVGIGFSRLGFETNYAYLKTKDDITRHYVSLTFRGF